MVSSDSTDDLELLLRRIIPRDRHHGRRAGRKWRGGTPTLKPGHQDWEELADRNVLSQGGMLRNRLRTLEQQVNSAELPDDAKVRLQAYISGCYGSLTSFNVLFAEEGDQFKGAGE
jgi:hypothetical protein